MCDEYCGEGWSQADEFMSAKIGLGFGFRRQPRVRYVKGTRKRYWAQLCLHMTKRAAFRCAREWRDSDKRRYRVARKMITTKTGLRRWRWAVLTPIED